MDIIRIPLVKADCSGVSEPSSPELKRLEKLDKLFDIQLYAQGVLAGSEYWQRVWIIQEIVVSRSPVIRYGLKEVTLLRLDIF